MSKLAEIERRCADNRLRMTEQRRVLLRVIAEARDHPDVAELHCRVQAIEPDVALSTVYRAIRLLEAIGVLQRHDFNQGRSRYELMPKRHHDHLIDVKSGRVIEFRCQEIERLHRNLRLGAGAIAAVVLNAVLGPAADAATIYTADEEQGTVSVFDFERGPVATIGVGVMQHNVDLTPDGRTLLVVGVATHGAGQHRRGTLVLVDAGASKPAVAAEIAVGQHPAHVGPSTDGTRVSTSSVV